MSTGSTKSEAWLYARHHLNQTSTSPVLVTVSAMMGRAQHVKRRWRSRENWPRNIAAKTTGPVSTCTPTRQASSIPGVDVTGPCNCHSADGTASTCRPTLMASREPNDFPLHSARNYRPIDAIWLRSQSGRPSATTVHTCAPCKH